MEYIGSIKYDDKLFFSKEIVICGCGRMLTSIVSELAVMNLLNNVIAICDNDKKKWGTIIGNIEVHSYEYAFSNYPQAQFIVYNQYAKEIAEQLVRYTKNIHYIRM